MDRATFMDVRFLLHTLCSEFSETPRVSMSSTAVQFEASGVECCNATLLVQMQMLLAHLCAYAAADDGDAGLS
jgi:hypothetical protein